MQDKTPIARQQPIKRVGCPDYEVIHKNLPIFIIYFHILIYTLMVH
jgi:hypothetical protein